MFRKKFLGKRFLVSFKKVLIKFSNFLLKSQVKSLLKLQWEFKKTVAIRLTMSILKEHSNYHN